MSSRKFQHKRLLNQMFTIRNLRISVKRPEIVVISNQPEKDDQSIPESFGDSGVSLPKYGKAGSRGSVSEEDSGVGSEGHNQSDIADQTDTSSQADSPKPGLRRNNSDSDFDQILPICKNSDLTAEISEELKQMNGFSLEATGIK